MSVEVVPAVILRIKLVVVVVQQLPVPQETPLVMVPVVREWLYPQSTQA
jgi:hypothetical protein